MKTDRAISINLATTRQVWGFAEAVDGCLKAGITAISPWRDQIAAIGVDEAARIVRDNKIQVTGVCRGGMFPAETAAGRQAQIDDNLHAIDEAAALNADCLVLVVGGLPGSSKDLVGARQMVTDGIAAMLPHAKASGVKLAIEPLHPMYAADRACINTIDQALDVCEVLGETVGVAIDVYHVWWDPQLANAIARAGRMNRIFAHHICDWLVPTKDMLLDRGMMGDGVIDLPGIRKMVEDAGFFGPQEVEIFSQDNWWKRPGDEVLAVIKERVASVC
ncbi:sugar phosphate isomerase/epimerase family protein [Devosia neptuniae]|jgi:sugar phosphate isomerase/epimerase|uniref:sugar phosphate isomerase/epimerase family protein n=1 Tax=Devosia TaxID=46913 RepID=UPI0022AEF7EA|nr:sugar phosphate isomerase/epimerase family protein [Devosia neptuniae]MCZ4347861.1 sugar phosphate isomerase/epimerase [Devosia neptuniae]|tara:strand:- start:7541 stop:8368 length:828 start_codon:yes stop_codon:yes gene_type:complete